MSEHFPLTHPLYGRIARLQEAPFLDPAELARFTAEYRFDGQGTEFDVCPQCYFQTSGTSGTVKRIPYSAADLERQIEHEARAYATAGLGGEDVVLSLAPPPPSLAAWAVRAGAERLGARVLNDSYLDYDDALADGASGETTALFGTPLTAEMVGGLLAEDLGDLHAAMPRMRTAILFGDILPANLAARLRNRWGFAIRMLYGTVETDVIAIACPHGDTLLHPMTERLLIELIPETAAPEAGPSACLALEDCPDETRGELIVSDLDRDLLPLVRYRTGDVAEVLREPCPCGRPGPRLRILGRRANTIRLGPRPLHEVELHDAVAAALGTEYRDWAATIHRNGAHGGWMRMVIDAPAHVLEAQPLPGLHEELALLGLPAAAVDGAGGLRVSLVDHRDESPSTDAKARRLQFVA